jgi:hypothetical protein
LLIHQLALKQSFPDLYKDNCKGFHIGFAITVI